MIEIEVENVHVRYGEVVALSGASFKLPAGQVTALIGMNGSGKSSLFRAITGLIDVQQGRIRIAGVSPATARRSGVISYVPQSEEVDWNFPVSVAELVMMGRYGRQGFTRRPTFADRAAVTQALETVELSDLAGRQIGRLSGGQRKRAFLARCIAQEARILLLDEPFAGVDKASEATITRILRDLAANGRTVLVSTHDLPAVPDLADEVILLLRKVLFQGSVAEGLVPEKLVTTFGMDVMRGGGSND